MFCSIVQFYSGELCLLRVPCTQHLSRLSNLYFIHGPFEPYICRQELVRNCTQMQANAYACGVHIKTLLRFFFSFSHSATSTNAISPTDPTETVHIKVYSLCALSGAASILSHSSVSSGFNDNWNINTTNQCDTIRGAVEEH